MFNILKLQPQGLLKVSFFLAQDNLIRLISISRESLNRNDLCPVALQEKTEVVVCRDSCNHDTKTGHLLPFFICSDKLTPLQIINEDVDVN